MNGVGHVSLVGAGPGDPELLTLKAVRRLGEADLVLYDALVETSTLEFAAKARRFFVGKRAGREAIRQDAINRLMIREARRGHRIVRLKCGDPFVFGRGGEEALALAAAGVPCEVIPGISSAIAVPLLAGIPVTHRGLASAFLVVSGHAESAFGPVLGSLEPGKLADLFVVDGNPLQDIAGFIVHMGELVGGDPTNHLDLRKKLAKTAAGEFLYYKVV